MVYNIISVGFLGWKIFCFEYAWFIEFECVSRGSILLQEKARKRAGKLANAFPHYISDVVTRPLFKVLTMLYVFWGQEARFSILNVTKCYSIVTKCYSVAPTVTQLEPIVTLWGPIVTRCLHTLLWPNQQVLTTGPSVAIFSLDGLNKTFFGFFLICG